MRFIAIVIILIAPFQSVNAQNRTIDSCGISGLTHENYFCLADSSKHSYFTNKGINLDSAYCHDLYCEVYDWLGVRYRYGHGTKQGTDCSSFTLNVTRNTMEYMLSGSSANIYESCIKINKESLQEGDLVFFKINKSRISHVGVYLQNGKFAHASVHGGVMISDLNEPYYKKYFVSGGRPIQ
ncbi:MAG: C40 family peptidase [Flavobacteriales bacterium]